MWTTLEAVANFADLCLSARQPPSRLPVRLATPGFEENLAPATGIINSVLIGELVWLTVLAAVALI